MLRFRRYRTFLAIAAFAIITLYHFSTVKDWEGNVARVEHLAPWGHGHSPARDKDTTPAITKPKADPVDGSKGSGDQSPLKEAGTTTIEILPKLSDIPGLKDGTFALGGEGRHEAPTPLADKPAIHWSKMAEHFPVPSSMLISLPTGTPAAIPKIQFQFKDESPTQKIDREKKRSVIKEAFQHSWGGYRKYAWGHDELTPVTGEWKDTFGGWGATLVDALDTLWIMGLRDEFEAATDAIRQIDFTTTTRDDIPLFETTIRYLGGLLSAYDISGGKYRVLLTKAEELGTVLMGAFDTPNRMPITYYYWKP